MRDKEITIISGTLKGRKLKVLDEPGVRPTSSRTRETLFNWLQDLILGKNCLDLFAGTGALGFECVSRGASSCVLVDSNPVVCKEIKEKTSYFSCFNVNVIRSDALRFLMNNDELFDIVFLDPPFGTNLLRDTLKLMKKSTLKKESLVYVEGQRGLSSPEGWTVLKKSHSRNVEFMLLGQTS
ncbi:16S rRNA (guanine(966)-N(2))-methyltransferase RsmD [Pseudomonadota bacterium]|nr:16S rRNA (guanine(966)-N(2))-methyltransferase RsmD [Pseudomonadota bacterium]|tara:strand:- start:43 stop:588 length:546 start_codon:yes stop_codon:yes gene_type:complete